jgi:hypothetical protein
MRSGFSPPLRDLVFKEVKPIMKTEVLLWCIASPGEKVLETFARPFEIFYIQKVYSFCKKGSSYERSELET